MNTMNLLERPRWSPYLAGAGIGLLNVATLLGVGRMLGVTSPFESLAALASGKVAPKVMHVDAYQRERKTEPRLDWELMLDIGIIAGSYLGVRMSRRRPWYRLPREKIDVRRQASALVGGAIMMMGARMAGGCTSGHGISGTSQLALSSLVFNALMATTGAIAARAVYGRR